MLSTMLLIMLLSFLLVKRENISVLMGAETDADIRGLGGCLGREGKMCGLPILPTRTLFNPFGFPPILP